MRLAARRARRRRSTVRESLLNAPEESAPELSLINLVDIMLVFAVGLLLALVNRSPALLSPTDTAPAVSPQRMKLTGNPQHGSGTRVGTAYQLPSGDIIYVPDAPNK